MTFITLLQAPAHMKECGSTLREIKWGNLGMGMMCAAADMVCAADWSANSSITDLERLQQQQQQQQHVRKLGVQGSFASAYFAHASARWTQNPEHNRVTTPVLPTHTHNMWSMRWLHSSGSPATQQSKTSTISCTVLSLVIEVQLVVIHDS